MSGAAAASSQGPVIVQRCDRFVARTMNWLYDHLRCVPRHHSLVVTDMLENRAEFPALEARQANPVSLPRRLSLRLRGRDVDPFLARSIARRRPRAMHSHFGYVAVTDYGLWQSLEVPWAIGFYGADVYALGRQPQWRARYQPIWDACSRALALGPVMARHIEQLGCPAAKVLVHPLGVEASELPNAPRVYRPPEALRVLFTGTFREKKGIEYVLRAVAAVRKEGVPIELELVAEAADKPGDRETEAAAMRLMESLGLQDVVIRYKFLTFRELLQLSLRCHVFVAPSVTAADGDSEGTPFVLQQMMATAMPVIATHHADIPYLCGDLAELLVQERDVEGIVTRLIEYARNPALLTEHGRAFRAQILGNFDVRACAARLSEIYDSM